MTALGRAPGENVRLPGSVQELAEGGDCAAVWINEVGGITFRLERRGSVSFVKWTPAGSGIDLSAEKARLVWARRFIAVPQVLGEGRDHEGSWLLMSALEGETAVAERWLANPVPAVRAIGHGLRMMHEQLPQAGCPFTWSVEERLAEARARVERAEIDRQSWHPAHRHLSIEAALELLAQPPPIDRLVVCHGDACAPNTLLDTEGRVTGHVDLGSLGVADRWADLAVASWSTRWNYGEGFEPELFAAYGVDRDPARLAYYRLLWDLGP